MQIPKEIILYFAKSHIPTNIQLDGFEDEIPASVKNILDKITYSIPLQDIQDHISDPKYKYLYDGLADTDTEQSARKKILINAISHQVNQERIQLLQHNASPSRVAPYNHKALSDLTIIDNLVQLNNFELENHRLERKGYVFELALTLQAENSSYWLKQNLLPLVDKASVFVRLDPLAIQDRNKYHEFMYKMWVYGVPLDWDQIVTLREDLHGRWMADSLLNTPSAFTDVVWSPRGDEIHFICEEVPRQNDVLERGSRYFHAILQKATRKFIHVDGAIRFYSKNELQDRLEVHVRHSGKVGKRVKIFRVDGEIKSEILGGVASSFFIWNNDVINYFARTSEFPDENTLDV